MLEDTTEAFPGKASGIPLGAAPPWLLAAWQITKEKAQHDPAQDSWTS